MDPVFIFGTGRCGSTHLQRLVSLFSECWIWGEHDGFLAPLLQSLNRFEQSQRLQENVFSQAARRDSETMRNELISGAGGLAWLNSFQKDSLRAELRSLIDRLFRSGVPRGWTAWGFKEILYGLGDDSPCQLLGLFPHSTAAFTFRRPDVTLESMIKAWNPKLIANELLMDELERVYHQRANRWKSVVSYFLNAKERLGSRLVFISQEQLNRSSSEILQVLNICPREGKEAGQVAPTNVGSIDVSEAARVALRDVFRPYAADLMPLYTRAVEISGKDFSSLPPVDASDTKQAAAPLMKLGTASG